MQRRQASPRKNKLVLVYMIYTLFKHICELNMFVLTYMIKTEMYTNSYIHKMIFLYIHWMYMRYRLIYVIHGNILSICHIWYFHTRISGWRWMDGWIFPCCMLWKILHVEVNKCNLFFFLPLPGVLTQDIEMFGNSWVETEPHQARCPMVPSGFSSPCAAVDAHVLMVGSLQKNTIL